MGDVEWIKMYVGMFDGNSFKKIKKAKIGGERFRDKLTAVWFELLDFAGKSNAGGMLIETPEIAFTNIEDIAILIDRDAEELNLCMQYYINNGMVTVFDDVYMLTNWAKYQNEDGLSKIREQTRKRVAKHRENKKLLQCNASVTHDVTQCNATEEEKEEEKEKEIEKEENKIVEINKRGEDIIKLYRELCSSLPPLEIVSTTIKETLNNSLNEYTLEQFETVFRKASSSTFLCGKNERKWVATFDWLVNAENMAKVLNGKYDDRNVAYVGKNTEDGAPAIVIPEDKEREERMRIKVEELKKRVGLGDAR